MAVTCGDIPRVFCSVIIPPIGVAMQVGCNGTLGLNILLTVLGYIPGLIHAIYIICKE
uniref:Protein Ric1 n=1 Tax=Globisporangium ultimum (strain ATCC 200006 / CBS 805.95 / DAOM BR144) TaxID=431595 RepID=K3WXR0_GLOUD